MLGKLQARKVDEIARLIQVKQNLNRQLKSVDEQIKNVMAGANIDRLFNVHGVDSNDWRVIETQELELRRKLMRIPVKAHIREYFLYKHGIARPLGGIDNLLDI
jgi:hypothetical protein